MPQLIKTSRQNKIDKIVFWFLLLVIIYLPLQFLDIEIMRQWLHLPEWLVFWVAHFYEPLFVIFLIWGIIYRIIKKDYNISPTISITILLIVLGFFSIFFLSPSLSRGVEGFRFTLFGVLVFFIVSLFNFKAENYNLLIKTYVIIAFILSFWAILERLLPVHYWQYIFGAESQFGYGAHKIVNFSQSMAIFGGPNQLASYILPAIFLLLLDSKKTNSNNQILNSKQITNHKFKYQNLKIILILLIALAIVLTFSRSAIVALILTLLIYFIFFAKNKYQKWIGTTAVIIVPIVLGLFLYSGTPQMKDIVTHGASQSLHIGAMKHSFWEIGSRINRPIELFFGSGIGTAGPAVLKYGSGFVSESWYLQVAIEMGVFGIVLWLILLYYLLRDLIHQNKGLFLGLLSVSVTAIFLHTWADNPAITVTMFILVGAVVQDTKSKLQVTNK